MILITSYYISDNKDRQKELDKCLIKNSENNYIEKIYLLNNEIFNLDFIFNQKKFEQVIITNEKNYKLKYNDAIKFINNNLEGSICILSNCDIYFDNSLSKIYNVNGVNGVNESNRLNENNLFALLRYDEDKNSNKIIFKFFDEPRNDSQDSWIFKSPLKVDLDKINFSFGTLGCDSIFANIVYESGIKVTNPCYDIITTHVHNTEYRTYSIDDRIHGKYCLIPPCYLKDDYEVKFMDY